MTDINAEPIQVLDKGYVKLIETWGSDEVIIESARMSMYATVLRCPFCGAKLKKVPE